MHTRDIMHTHTHTHTSLSTHEAGPLSAVNDPSPRHADAARHSASGLRCLVLATPLAKQVIRTSGPSSPTPRAAEHVGVATKVAPTAAPTAPLHGTTAQAATGGCLP